MRVTAQTQAATRERIREVARQLFAAHGFPATTTRDIAQEAQIATGTLFNYFSSKEAIAADLAMEAVAGINREFANEDSGAGSLEEELFAFVAAGLRKLKPLRRYLPAVLETVLSPLATGRDEDDQTLRLSHLEVITRLVRKHGFAEASSVALQIYWSLYTGLLLFWANDQSPKQEDTLALLDHSLEMFVGWLRSRPGETSIEPQET